MSIQKRGLRILGCILTGSLAAAISLLRLQLSNSDALRQNLWAEDGLFPLCVRKADVFECLTEPFAGYLLAVPRFIAGFVSLWPLMEWAAIANIAAAALVGVCAGVIFSLVYRSGFSAAASALVSLLIVAVPLVGVEGINVYASSYMPLLVAATLAVSFVRSDIHIVWYWIGLLLVSATLPSAIILLLPVAVYAIRGQITARQAVAFSSSLTIGFLMQLVTALTATEPRLIEVNEETFRNWVDATPQAVATLIPGTNVGEATEAFGMGSLQRSPLLGAILLLAIVGTGGWLVLRNRSPQRNGIGFLLLLGTAFGAIPSISGYVSNRYFVVPVVLWAAAAALGLDAVLRSSIRNYVFAGLATILAILWLPSMPASEVRATPNPPWQPKVTEWQDACDIDPNLELVLEFSPYSWPQRGGDALTSASTDCASIAR